MSIQPSYASVGQNGCAGLSVCSGYGSSVFRLPCQRLFSERSVQHSCVASRLRLRVRLGQYIHLRGKDGALLAGVSILFLSTIVMMFMAGGLIPSVFLPEAAAGAGKFTPVFFLMEAVKWMVSEDMSGRAGQLAACGCLRFSGSFVLEGAAFCLAAAVRSLYESNGTVVLSVFEAADKTPLFPASAARPAGRALVASGGIASGGGGGCHCQSPCYAGESDWNRRVADELLSGEHSFQFYLSGSEEELREDVAARRAECGYIFSEDLLEKLESGRFKRSITLVTAPSTAVDKLSSEVVFSGLFTVWGRSLLETYTSREGEVFQGEKDFWKRLEPTV